jgi:D-lactate dehydrogenase (cytochrome)
MRRVFQACDEIVGLCLERGGSITGEHGVGIEKRKYMPAMYTGAELSAMRDIKTLLDPENLLNPGKIFPPDLPYPLRALPALPVDSPFAPGSTEEAAAGLAALSQSGRRVTVGGAAKGDPGEGALWLTTANLRGVVEYAQNDLYVTARAGMRVETLQTFLAGYNMQAPLAEPWADATLGGVVAANANAPLRMRYGALRDIVIALTVALADGRVIRAGRNVVKNVAGYDLTKLFIGSHGTLGLITDVTLKLTPRPRAQATLAVPVADPQQGFHWAARLLPHLLVASGLVLAPGELISEAPAAPYYLLLTAEGVPEDVQAELAEAKSVLRQTNAPVGFLLEAQNATTVWGAFLRGQSRDALLVRAGLPPDLLAAYAAQTIDATPLPAQWLFDVGNGLAYVRATPGDEESAQAWLAALREPALALDGYAVAVNVPAHLDNTIDWWGYQPNALDLMRNLKTRWDPAGILNPGWFVV